VPVPVPGRPGGTVPPGGGGRGTGARAGGPGTVTGAYPHPVPSYRVRLVPGLLLRGTDPAAVLPAAVDAARAHTTVEAGTVEVVRAEPRITVRYEAPDDLTAAQVGRAVVARVGELVVVETSRVTRRNGNRWYPMR
jgi:hypothetical protein